MAKKRKNKSLPLIILVVLLIGLIVGYSVLSSANDRREAEEAKKNEAENNTVIIADYDYTTATKLSYSAPDADGITLLQNSGVWSYAEDANFPLNQTIAAQMASAISSIGIKTTVTEGEAADYGLDTPSHTIEISYSDGTSHTYKIGNYNSFNDGYYFSMDGKLYMIASGLLDYFDYSLEELLALDTLPTTEWADLGYVNEIKVTTAEKENAVADDTSKNEIMKLIGSLSLTECADYYADAEEKNSYGLDGSCAFAVKYKKAVISTDASGNQNSTYLDTVYTVNIGALTDGGYYISPASSNIVYLADEETVNDILSFVDHTSATDESKA